MASRARRGGQKSKPSKSRSKASKPQKGSSSQTKSRQPSKPKPTQNQKQSTTPKPPKHGPGGIQKNFGKRVNGQKDLKESKASKNTNKHNHNNRFRRMSMAESPMKAVRRSKRRLTAIILAIVIILAALGATQGAWSVYLHNLTNTEIIQESEGPVSLNKTLVGPTEKFVTGILGDKQLLATMATDDTRTYMIEDTQCMIIISRVATDVTDEDALAVIEEQLGDTEGITTEMTFPDANIMSEFPGHYYVTESQKMLIGYVLNTDGYLYCITYTAPLAEYSQYESNAMSLINTCSFKDTSKM